jgi:HPt (histidine-containing phosphotransfer) domain-containing protein
LVSEYLDCCRKDLSALSTALVERDYERARIFGHQMKGTGSPFGFPSLTRFGAAIEQAAAHKDTPALDHLVNQLEEYLSRVEITGE